MRSVLRAGRGRCGHGPAGAVAPPARRSTGPRHPTVGIRPPRDAAALHRRQRRRDPPPSRPPQRRPGRRPPALRGCRRRGHAERLRRLTRHPRDAPVERPPGRSRDRRSTAQRVLAGTDSDHRHQHSNAQPREALGQTRDVRAGARSKARISAALRSRLPHTPYDRRRSNDAGGRQRVLRICISDGSFVPHLSEPTVQQDIEFRDSVALSEDNLLSLLRVYDNEGDFNTWDCEKWLLREYLLVLQNRRLFIAEDGRLGLAQNTLRTGDTIIIAHGSATPLIIRATDKSHQAFHFIGQCYLENAMFGEECDFENWPISTFTIM